MKTIGLVGGISWTSTLDYYRCLNEEINKKLGGLESAKCVLYSLNFADIQRKGWVNSRDLILEACLSLILNRVDAIALCCNTAHLFTEDIQCKMDVPLIHIAEATAKEINLRGIRKVGLLGTKFTMEMGFYKETLGDHDIQVLTPRETDDIDEIQRILKEELGKGQIYESSRKKLIKYSEELIQRGAEGIVLGCTEIPMLMGEQHLSVPVFDTTKIHVDSIVSFMLEEL